MKSRRIKAKRQFREGEQLKKEYLFDELEKEKRRTNKS